MPTPPRLYTLCWTSSTALFVILPDDFYCYIKCWVLNPPIRSACMSQNFQDTQNSQCEISLTIAAVFLCIPMLQTSTGPSNFHAPSSSSPPWKCASPLMSSCWDIWEWESCEAGCWGWRHWASLRPAGHLRFRLVGASYAALEFTAWGLQQWKEM